MRSLGKSSVILLSLTILIWMVPAMANANSPIAILTLAFDAHLDKASAFAGLSVYEDEQLWTEHQGRLAARMGGITLALEGDSVAMLHRTQDGAHVDLESGSIFFSSPEKSEVEVHLEDALLRSEGGITQAQIRIVGDKLLEVTTRRGVLDFSYREEFQVLPEGKTFRIELDSPAVPPRAEAGNTGNKPGPPPARHGKVAYYILGTAGVGAAIYGLFQLLEPESPSGFSKH
jgi:hypothetical protein